MEQENVYPLQGYQFVYSDSVVGSLAFWDGSLTRISRVLDATFNGGSRGLVTLINPVNGRIMGQDCLSRCIPASNTPKHLIKKISHDSVSDSDSEYGDEPATRKDIWRLEKKIKKLTQLLLDTNKQNV